MGGDDLHACMHAQPASTVRRELIRRCCSSRSVRSRSRTRRADSLFTMRRFSRRRSSALRRGSLGSPWNTTGRPFFFSRSAGQQMRGNQPLCIDPGVTGPCSGHNASSCVTWPCGANISWPRQPGSPCTQGVRCMFISARLVHRAIKRCTQPAPLPRRLSVACKKPALGRTAGKSRGRTCSALRLLLSWIAGLLGLVIVLRC